MTTQTITINSADAGLNITININIKNIKKTKKHKKKAILVIEGDEELVVEPKVDVVAKTTAEPTKPTKIPKLVRKTTYAPTANEATRVKKGFKGAIHLHKVNDDGTRGCPYCDYTTKNGSTLSMHITRIHPLECGRDISPHQCKYCGQGFQASTNLQHHIRNMHEIVLHKCPVAGCSYEKAKNTTTLANHISAKHLKHCYENDTCNCCNTYVGSSIKYHVAFCCETSPLFKKK